MFKNLAEATEYIISSVQITTPDVEWDPIVVENILSQYMIDELEWDLSESQKEHIFEKINDVDYLETYFAQHIPNFYTSLDNAVKRYLTPYFIQIEE